MVRIPSAATAAAALWVGAAMLAGACFDAPEPACAFACGEYDTCPAAYRCASDGWCKREDVDEDYPCGARLHDAAPTDASPPSGNADTAWPDAGPPELETERHD